MLRIQIKTERNFKKYNLKLIGKEENDLENKMVTINPKLTSKSLQELVDQTRKLIINIYLQCEREYQEGLRLFEAIVGERMLQNSISKKEALQAQLYL